MHKNYEIRSASTTIIEHYYTALLVLFFAGLLSPSTLRSSEGSGFAAPNTGPAGTLPNKTFLPPRLAGLIRPGGPAAALSAGFEGARSLVPKSSLVAGPLVGGTPLVDFFLGGEAMRDGPSWLDVGRDTGAGAGSLLTAILRGMAFGLVEAVVVSTDCAVSTGDNEGASKVFPGVAIFDRLDCLGFSALGVGTTGSSEMPDAG